MLVQNNCPYNQSTAPISQKQTPKTQLLLSSIRPEHNLAISVYKPNQKVLEHTHGTGFMKYPTLSPDNLWLVFSSEYNGKTSLYIKPVECPHAPAQKLTDGTTFEGQAAIASDGMIYFTSSAAGSLDIYRGRFSPLETLSLKQCVNLTQGQGANFSPAISPDGKTLAFTSNRHNPDDYQGPSPKPNYQAGSVYTMDAHGDGSDAKMVTPGIDDNGQAVWQGGPTWSKDGSSLVFYSGVDNQFSLHRLNLGTGNITKEFTQPGKALYPRIHPETNALVFAHQKADNKRWKILCKDESGVSKLLSQKGIHFWSPLFKNDGSLIVSHTHKEKGSFLFESLPCAKNVQLTSVRGYFPIQEEDWIFSVEDMSKVVMCKSDGTESRTLFEPSSAVFGLGKAPGHFWLMTSAGTPFAETRADIWKISTMGKAPLNVTQSLGGRNVWPTVKPDASKMAFVHQALDSPYKDLYEMDLTKPAFRQLYANHSICTFPSYSPDGKHLVFSETTDKIHYKVRSLELATNTVTDITDGRHADTHPCMSPDGEVAFSSDRGGFNEETPYAQTFFNPQHYGDVYVRSADGVARFTDTGFEQSTPSWGSSLLPQAPEARAAALASRIIALSSEVLVDANLFHRSPF